MYSATSKTRRQDRAHYRHRAGEIQDRNDEPRLQDPLAGPARADGSCVRLSALTGGVCVASCKEPRSRRARIKTAPIGGSPWHERRTPLAQPTQIAQSRYSSRFPLTHFKPKAGSCVTSAKSTNRLGRFSWVYQQHRKGAACAAASREVKGVTAQIQRVSGDTAPKGGVEFRAVLWRGLSLEVVSQFRRKQLLWEPRRIH